MKLVIVAGGKGTRLRALNADLPKCLTLLGERSLLEHHLALARCAGVENVVLLTGHGSEQIESLVGDGSRFGVRIRVFREPEPLGTAGAFAANDALWDGPMWVLYGDVACNIDVQRFADYHRRCGGVATLFAHPNDHPYDSDLLEVDAANRITAIHRKPHAGEAVLGNLVNAATYIVEPGLRGALSEKHSDWAHDVFPRALDMGLPLYAYRSSEYIKDMGTPERLAHVQRDMAAGVIEAGGYRKPRPAVFLDRDGTINEEVGHCRRPEDFHLFPGVPEAIRRINASGYLAIVVTNQPAVARGLCEVVDVLAVHRKMETLLGNYGAYVDDVYFCPHHPDKGFPEENPAYKVKCNCRKPATGMVEEAVHDHCIDLSRSVFIGDTTRDIQTGRRLGIRTVLVETGYAGGDGTFDVQADASCPDLASAIDFALTEENT